MSLTTARVLVAADLDQEDIARFWSKVAVGDTNDCWPWIAPSRTTYGYGLFKRNGKSLFAHRISLALAIGEVPSAILVLHNCDNPPCCNPAHLRVGTHRDNIMDAIAKGRAKPPKQLPEHYSFLRDWRAKNLPNRGMSHPSHKLTDSDVRMIRAALANGISGVCLGKVFGCSDSTISHIRKGKHWKHIPIVNPDIVEQRR